MICVIGATDSGDGQFPWGVATRSCPSSLGIG